MLRLPFIIDTSLGHEIAHCWWGNGVYVDYNNGNWSEALTTYVADYLYKEKKSDLAARSYRRQILRNYATLVKPQNDFALTGFISRQDPLTKAVGYDKGAMVFHMLRKILGEEAFWGGLRDIYQQRIFQPTSWADLQRAFEIRAHRSLQDFFNQWVSRKGAPNFYLDRVTVEQSDGHWMIRGRIAQEKPYYSFRVKLTLESGSQKWSRDISVSAQKATFFEMQSNTAPYRLIVDPDYDIMRRLHDAEVPPSINSLKSSPSVLVVVTENAPPEIKEAAGLMARSLGLKRYQFVSANTVSQKQLHENDLLVIGHPEQEALLGHMPHEIMMDNFSFSLHNMVYDQPSDVFFGVFAHPFAEDRVAALFWPLSPVQAEVVARKVTHYGKYSYLVFQNGQNREKGFWQPENSPLVFQWNRKTN